MGIRFVNDIMPIPLTELKPGEKGVITSILEGIGVRQKILVEKK